MWSKKGEGGGGASVFRLKEKINSFFTPPLCPFLAFLSVLTAREHKEKVVARYREG